MATCLEETTAGRCDGGRGIVGGAAEELRQLAPRAGEEMELASTRALLMNAGRLAQDVSADIVAPWLASAILRVYHTPLPTPH